MAEVILFPTGLVAAANYAARAAAGEHRPVRGAAVGGANVILMPQCRSVAMLEDQLERMKERLAAEIGATGRTIFATPFPVSRCPRSIEGGVGDRPGNHWTAS